MDLRIRRYRLDDADAVYAAVRESQPDMQPWMPWCHPDYSIEESHAWLALQVPAFDLGSAYEFAMVDADGRYLGGCGLNQLDPANRRANLGYWVRSSARRQGAATAAVRQLRDWAFEHTDLLRLEIVVAVDNLASCGVAEKAGAGREATLRRRLVLSDVAHDAVMFAFTRSGGDHSRSDSSYST